MNLKKHLVDEIAVVIISEMMRNIVQHMMMEPVLAQIRHSIIVQNIQQVYNGFKIQQI